MAESKQQQVRDFIKNKVWEAIDSVIADQVGYEKMDSAKALAGLRQILSIRAAHNVSDEYAFLKLADIMEWKKTRTRR